MASPSQKIIFSTERLDMIPFDLEDPTHAQFLVSLWNTPLFISTCGKTGIDTLEKAKGLIERRFVKEYALHGYGSYILRLKPEFRTEEITKAWPENLIGTVSLTIGDSPDSNTAPDVGFAVVPEMCGKGIATEAAKGVMAWADKELGLKDVFGFCDPENTVSRKVLEKSGLEFRCVQKLACFGGELSAVYALPSMNKDLSVYNVKE